MLQSIIFVFIIVSLLLITFLGGVYSAQQSKFSRNWYKGVYIPLFVLVFFNWIFQAPWFWVVIQVVLQLACFWVGAIFKKTQLTNADVERLEKIGDLGLDRWFPAGLKDEQIAIVLLSQGGPASVKEVKPFMRRVFNDSQVFRFPLIQSWFAYFFVNDRLKKFQDQYESIGGASPLPASCAQQVAALKEELFKRGRSIQVFLSLSYSNPLPSETIAKIKEVGKKYILPLSLDPQYSFSTTEAYISHLKVAAEKIYPELRFLESYSYHMDDAYIQALVDRIHETLKPGESLNDFYLLFSAQGTPTYFLEEGDQYSYLISQTVACVLKKINRSNSWSISYQGSVGHFCWLEPSTENVLIALAQKAVRKAIVIPISFVNERIETLYEIDIELRDLAQGEGIRDFRMMKAIGCHTGFISALANCVEHSLSSPDAPKRP